MSIPGLFSTQITQGPPGPHIFVGGNEVTRGPSGAGVPASSITITTGIDAAGGSFQALVEDPLLTYGLAARARVLVTDDSVPAILFDGFLTRRTAAPDFGQQGRAAQIVAESSAALLDYSAVIPSIAYPAGMSDQAMIQSLVGAFCTGEIYTMPYVQLTNAGMPAMAFGSQTIRNAIEQIGIAANGDGQGERHYYIDPYRNLHYFVSEANPAPKNINPVVSGSEIAPSDFSIDYDDSAIRTAVFIRGSNAAGTGYVTWGAGIGAYGWVADSLDVTDSDSFSKLQAYGYAYLVPRSVPIIRGSFTVDQGQGWAAGQTVLVTLPSMGLAAAPFLIYAVTRSQASGAYARYQVSFGAKPPRMGNA